MYLLCGNRQGRHRLNRRCRCKRRYKINLTQINNHRRLCARRWAGDLSAWNHIFPSQYPLYNGIFRSWVSPREVARRKMGSRAIQRLWRINCQIVISGRPEGWIRKYRPCFQTKVSRSFRRWSLQVWLPALCDWPWGYLENRGKNNHMRRRFYFGQVKFWGYFTW